MTKVPLSKRVRPTSEVPQYVYDEIVALETERDEARAEVARLQKGLDGLLNEREGNERAYRMVREARDHVPCAHKDGK